jgi:hypothetical protein
MLRLNLPHKGKRMANNSGITLENFRQNPIVQNFEEIGRFLKPDFSGPNDGLSGLMKLMEVGAVGYPFMKPAVKFARGLGEKGNLDKNSLKQLMEKLAMLTRSQVGQSSRGLSPTVIKRQERATEAQRKALQDAINKRKE